MYIQSRTIKLDKLRISSSDFSGEKITPDPNSDGSKDPKNEVIGFFPRLLRPGQIFGPFQRLFNLIKDSLYREHCSLRDTAVSLLLSYSPCCCFPCHPSPVSIHEAPRSIHKFSDNVCWTGIKTFKCYFLCIFKVLLGNISISIFTPPPVLAINNLLVRAFTNELTAPFQWGLTRNETSVKIYTHVLIS